MKTYSARELAEILNSEGDESMTERRIRHYRDIDLLPPLYRIKNKNYFTENHLSYLRAMRTMQRTGESLSNIGETLMHLEIRDWNQIGKRMNYVSSNYVLSTVVEQVNEDISVTFSDRVLVDERDAVLNAVKNCLGSVERKN